MRMLIWNVFFLAEALRLYRTKLTAYEQEEILDYNHIWYLGIHARKIEGKKVRRACFTVNV